MEEDINRIRRCGIIYTLEYDDKKALINILNELERLQKEFKAVDHECSRLEKKELRLEKENELYKHRLEVADCFIESRIDNMIPEHYEDLKYIINECDMNSSW